MVKCVLIGNIKEYQSKFNLIHNEVKNGNISVLGIYFTDNPKFDMVDNFIVIDSLELIIDFQFDYFILLNDDKIWYKKLKQLNFKQKVIPIRVFDIPYFDFKKYEKLLENPPSIICRHCWGGRLYQYIGMEFLSPFINLYLTSADFNKLSKNFTYYIQQELVFDHEQYERNLKRNFPVAKLDDISIYFNHYLNFEEAKTKWDERKKRINYNNLFFETATQSKEIALEFDKLPLEHKVCFFTENIDGKTIVDFSGFINKPQALALTAIGTVKGSIPYFDVLELLLNNNIKPRVKFFK